MSKKTWVLTLLGAGLLARSFMKKGTIRQRPGRGQERPGETMSDSPNAAERLRQSHAYGAGAGIATAPNQQDGGTIGPGGMSDFLRGG